MPSIRNQGARAAAVALWALFNGFAIMRSEAADWRTGAGPEWADLIAGAGREGKVVVAGNPALSGPLQDAFKRDTGIDLEFLGGTAREIAARLARETQSGNVTVDLSLGGASDLLTLYPRGYLMPIKPQMILPGVQDGPNWIRGKRLWVDDEAQYMFRGTLSVGGWPLINTTIIARDAIKSWQDLLSPAYKGKIAAFDPTAPGQGQASAGNLVDRFGVAFLKALYLGQDIRYTRDNRQLLDWVSHGTYPIALGTEALTIERFRKQGLPIQPIIFDGWGDITSGFSVLKEMKGAPHPKAAAVFINWYASAPGQSAYSRIMLEASTRADVSVPEVPDYIKPQPGFDYTDAFSEAWYKNIRPVVTNLVVEALGGR